MIFGMKSTTLQWMLERSMYHAVRGITESNDINIDPRRKTTISNNRSSLFLFVNQKQSPNQMTRPYNETRSFIASYFHFIQISTESLHKSCSSPFLSLTSLVTRGET